MSFMFSNATSFNADISNWNTCNVTCMNNMFQKAANFNQNISTKKIDSNYIWWTGNVGLMNNMFFGATWFDINYISNWNLDMIITIKNIFNDDIINNLDYKIINTKPCIFNGIGEYSAWDIDPTVIHHNIDLTKVNWKSGFDRLIDRW